MMAKLEGVKTLDMVNGEITKVAYGGAKYERVEGEAKVGDIALAIKSAEDTTLGNFYPVTDTSHGDIMYMDDVDDEQVNPPECFRIFRKVAASTNPSVEDRVAKAEGEIESLKSEVAALKGEAEYKQVDADEAKVGDYVKFDDPPSYLTDKEYYAIVRLDHCGDPQVIDDEGDEFDTDGSDFEVYRKVSATEPKSERWKVGDYAKVVNATDYHKFSDGDIVEILEDSFTHGNNECARRITDESIQYILAKELVRATDEEVAEAKDEVARAKFKKGVKVRLLSGGEDYPLGGFTDGKIYEVSDNDYNHHKGRLIRIEGGNCYKGSGFATPDQLEILSEEEAAEHKKWAEIGRKVNEYKKGDIVRVVNASGSDNENGDIGEITRINGSLFAVDTTTVKFGNFQLAEDIELITPVEARFDR
ncbi:hypothetical protein [Bacillus subtilis]|uniref:hypothetical protein n=1 Tax=Bacillus subtilis TaxID=1423 RepID=UPI001BA5C899|nr:hypothetical protein [Bacillus subtilis]QUG79115.1 hypothetical protein GSN02_06435 [Bacillus subtilis]